MLVPQSERIGHSLGRKSRDHRHLGVVKAKCVEILSGKKYACLKVMGSSQACRAGTHHQHPPRSLWGGFWGRVKGPFVQPVVHLQEKTGNKQSNAEVCSVS